MTLAQVITAIETAAMAQPSVEMIVRNDIFRLNACPDARYGVFAWLQGEHGQEADADLRQYAFTFFYVDRLTADKGNEVDIQSAGIDTLTNIVRYMEERYDGLFAIGRLSFQTFNQRFADECAGVFCRVTFETPAVQTACAESFADFSNDFNRDFYVF
jgi:hypothetical protein